MSERYLILRELGQEDGPYTVDELRHLLSTGRLRSDDRLRPEQDRPHVDLKTLIPDCAEISAARPKVQERIRRKSAERGLPESSGAAEGSSTVTSPPPTSVTPEAPQIPSTLPFSAQRGSLPRLSSKQVGIILAVVIVLVGWWSWPREPAWLSPEDLVGTWSAPDLSVTVHGNTLDIDDDGRRVTMTYQVVMGSVDGLILALTPVHPRFGAKIAIVRDRGTFTLQHHDQTIPLERR